MKIVSVTGGTGFIGRHLVTTLLSQGFYVRVLSREPKRILRLWPKSNIEPWKGDLTSLETLRGFARDAQFVYHLAGELHKPSLFNSVNVLGIKNLLTVCKGKKLRKFIHLSSVGVIGANKNNIVDESTPCYPMLEYEKSKYAAEILALTAFKKNRLPVTIIRPTIVFGEGLRKGHNSFNTWLYEFRLGSYHCQAKIIGHYSTRDLDRSCKKLLH